MLDLTARLTCSLEGFGTGSTKLASFEEFVFFFVCQRGAGVWPVALATFLDKPFPLSFAAKNIPCAEPSKHNDAKDRDCI